MGRHWAGVLRVGNAVILLTAPFVVLWLLLPPTLQEILWVLVKACAIAGAAYAAFVAALMRR